MSDVTGEGIAMHVGDPFVFGHVRVAGADVFGFELVFVDGGSSGCAHGRFIVFSCGGRCFGL